MRGRLWVVHFRVIGRAGIEKHSKKLNDNMIRSIKIAIQIVNNFKA